MKSRGAFQRSRGFISCHLSSRPIDFLEATFKEYSEKGRGYGYYCNFRIQDIFIKSQRQELVNTQIRFNWEKFLLGYSPSISPVS